MLEIRREQMEVFKQTALQNFEEQMVEHIKEFASEHSKAVGDSGIRMVIRSGMDRARDYGLTHRGPVRFYIELMFMLGSGFDTDPQLSWAREILNNATVSNQDEQANLLYDRTMEYINAVAGPNYEYEKDALQRVSRQRFEELPESNDNLENGISAILKRLYPQKYDYVGELTMQRLMHRGSELAESYSISNYAGVVLIVGLMFAFGHECIIDPQFPWISTTLTDSNSDQSRRVEHLYAKMMTYMGQALANLERK